MMGQVFVILQFQAIGLGMGKMYTSFQSSGIKLKVKQCCARN